MIIVGILCFLALCYIIGFVIFNDLDDDGTGDCGDVGDLVEGFSEVLDDLIDW